MPDILKFADVIIGNERTHTMFQHCLGDTDLHRASSTWRSIQGRARDS
jgi:hypothetical protein